MVNTALTYVFGGAAALLLLGAFLRRTKRPSMGTAALCAAGAAVAAHAGVFWPMATLALCAGWALFASGNYIDLAWRARAGFVGVVGLAALLSLWPTVHDLSGGRVPCPEYIQKGIPERLVAGLDLRGGIRLVYGVAVAEAIEDKRDGYADLMRAELARRFGLTESDERPTDAELDELAKRVEVRPSRTDLDEIVVTVADAADAARLDSEYQAQFAADLTYSVSADGKTFTYRLKSTLQSDLRTSAVEQAREVVLRRVDELGLKEAAVSTRGEDIIVEVPGTDEKAFDEIRQIIGKTARLEFKLVSDEDFFGPMASRVRSGEEPMPLAGLTFLPSSVGVGKDEEGELITKGVTEARLAVNPDETAQQALERFRGWTDTLAVPPGREIGFELETEPSAASGGQDKPVAWRTHFLKARTEITGDMVTDAQAQPDVQSGSGRWYVALTFNDRGARLFGNLTEANVGRNFAIILDERVTSAPVIQEAILGGTGRITMGGGSTETQMRDARQLELVLHSGALPAPIELINEQRIGPSLGRDAVKGGSIGAVGGSLLVIVFMLVYYSRAGLIADVAVGLNLLLQLATLAALQASMTLPGIAGLALTVGMSVDANVLINERIRDELDAGRTPRAAVEVGFEKAAAAIIDGNVTTLIAALVLMQFGSGPIKGFALTLFIGILANVFTGLVGSHVMFDLWVRRKAGVSKLQVG